MFIKTIFYVWIGDNMNEQELINCLREYCDKELKQAKSSAENEARHTSAYPASDDLITLYLSKLYYRSMALLAQRDLEEEHIKNRK
jgi:hypothetical protein